MYYIFSFLEIKKKRNKRKKRIYIRKTGNIACFSLKKIQQKNNNKFSILIHKQCNAVSFFVFMYFLCILVFFQLFIIVVDFFFYIFLQLLFEGGKSFIYLILGCCNIVLVFPSFLIKEEKKVFAFFILNFAMDFCGLGG